MTYINTNFYQQIALSRYSNIVSWSKLGYNPNIGTSEEDVWSAGGIGSTVLRGFLVS